MTRPPWNRPPLRPDIHTDTRNGALDYIEIWQDGVDVAARIEFMKQELC